MLHQEMRPSSAAPVPWKSASSAGQTQPKSGASARPLHTTPDTTGRAAALEPANWRCAAETYIARSKAGFEHEVSQILTIAGSPFLPEPVWPTKDSVLQHWPERPCPGA